MPPPKGYVPLSETYNPSQDAPAAPPGYELVPDPTTGYMPGSPENLHAQGPFKTLKDLAEGAGSGVANTAAGAGELVRKGGKALGVELPEVPEFLKKAGENVQYDEKGQPVVPSTMFKMGRGAEQMGEFFVPGGAITDAVTKASRYGSLAGAAMKTGAEAASAGTITAAQSGGDVKAGKDAAIMTGALVAPFASVEAALQAVRPSTLYAPKEIIAKIPERFRGDRLDEIIGQAIDNKIMISQGGVNKAKAIERGMQGQRDQMVAQQGSRLVDFNEVTQPLQEFKDIARRFGMTGTVSAIDQRIQALAEAHGFQPATPGTPARTITSPNNLAGPNGQAVTYTVPGTPGSPAVPPRIKVNEAQELKNFGQSLAHDAFGRMHETADVTKIHEVLSEGLMNSLETMIPELKNMNRNIQNTKIIKNAIEEYVNSNPELLNTKTAFWAMINPRAALTVGLLANPRVRSALAIAAHNNVISNLGSTGARIAAGGSSPVPQNAQLPDLPQGPNQ